MKFNKWTVGLAAAGIVTLPSLLKADPVEMVKTAAADTTLSGYVDVSAQWNIGTQKGGTSPTAFPPYSFGGASKADGFNLNVVDVALDKPLDESPWAAGYHVELWFGPDANTLNTSSYGYTFQDFAVRQAYVALRTPLGNGIDWKLGVFDSPLGYESTSSPNNPNFTRSYGYTIEPTELTGLMGTYKICDGATIGAGVANTVDAVVNERNQFGAKEDTKAYFGTFTLTAPESWGWINGSSLSVGYIHGFSATGTSSSGGSFPGSGNISHLYAGGTLATPVTGLKVGAAFDYRHDHDLHKFTGQSGDMYVYGLYASFQATEKLSLHARGEYGDFRDNGFAGAQFSPPVTIKGWEFTVTAQYDLWKNVLTRAEFRWDHADNVRPFGTTGLKNSYIAAANVVYKF
jgi:hypothetical protein